MKNYFRHKIKNLVSINEIVTIEYLTLDKDYSYGVEQHNFWEFVYCDQENVVCRCDEREIALKKGEILFHKPNEPHAIHADGMHAPSVFVMCFVCNSESMAAFELYHRALDKQCAAILANIIDEMKKTFVFPFNRKLILRHDPILGGQEVIRNYLELLLIFLLRKESDSSATTVFLSEENYEKQLSDLIVAYLKENVCGRLTIEDICRHFNYSKAYLSRIFKTFTGDTLVNYYNLLKVEEAKKLLVKEKLAINQISDRLCFSDPHYFSMLFKKVTGMPPTQYVLALNKP